jgi:hypothetical protein
MIDSVDATRRQCDAAPEVGEGAGEAATPPERAGSRFGTWARRQWTWRVVGWMVLAVSLYYVGSRLVENTTELSNIQLSTGVVECVIGASVLYGVALFLVAIAWGTILAGVSRIPIRVAQVVSVSGRSQILKYLPGNLFHLAGRQVLGGRLGWSQLSIATASVVETALLVIAAIAMITGASATRPQVQVTRWIPQSFVTTLGLASVAGVWLLLFLAPSVVPHRMAADGVRLRELARSFRLAAALLLYIAYFAVCAILFWGMVSSSRAAWEWRLLPDTALAFIVAWLAGYITPGAPGGLGVREAVTIYLLTPSCGEVVSLAAALAMRVVTTVGDLLFFAGASWCHARYRVSELGR